MAYDNILNSVSENFWKPIIFLGIFFICLIIIYILSYFIEMKDLNSTKQTLLLDEPVNIQHDSYLFSVSFVFYQFLIFDEFIFQKQFQDINFDHFIVIYLS